MLGLMLCMTSCAGTGAAIKPGCESFQAIYVSRLDVMTAETERQILAHNKTWRAICAR